MFCFDFSKLRHYIQSMVARNTGKLRDEEGGGSGSGGGGGDGDEVSGGKGGKAQRTGVVKVVDNVAGSARPSGAAFGKNALLAAAHLDGGDDLGTGAVGWGGGGDVWGDVAGGLLRTSTRPKLNLLLLLRASV